LSSEDFSSKFPALINLTVRPEWESLPPSLENKGLMSHKKSHQPFVFSFGKLLGNSEFSLHLPCSQSHRNVAGDIVKWPGEPLRFLPAVFPSSNSEFLPV